MWTLIVGVILLSAVKKGKVSDGWIKEHMVDQHDLLEERNRIDDKMSSSLEVIAASMATKADRNLGVALATFSEYLAAGFSGTFRAWLNIQLRESKLAAEAQGAEVEVKPCTNTICPQFSLSASDGTDCKEYHPSRIADCSNYVAGKVEG
jgi:hypothetical protein